MNTSTTPRRWAAAVATFALLIAARSAFGQCADFVAYPPGPVVLNLALGGGGTVSLTDAVLNSNGFTKNAACDYWLAEGLPTNPYSPTPATFDCSDVATSPQTWYVRAGGDPLIGDDGGPGATIVELTINILDNVAPTITCPANAMAAADPGLCSATVAGLNPTTADNCAVTKQTWVKTGATTGSSPAAGINSAGGTSYNVGVTTVTYTVSDASNNTATCSFTVTITDMQNPMITCPANQAANTDPGQCDATLTPPAPTTSDNCGVPALTWTAPGAIPASGGGAVTSVDFPEGMTTVTYTVTDAAALTATCAFTVTVNDNQAPVISGTPASQPNIGTSTGTATPGNLCDGSFSWNHPTITDNCAGPNTLTMQLSGATVVAAAGVTTGAPITQLFNLGVTTITYVATDVNGLTASSTFNVTVVDNVAPVVTPAPTNQNFNFSVTAGDCSKVVTFTRPSAGMIDDCGPVTFTETYFSGPDPNVLSGAPAFPMGGGGSITVQFPAGMTVIRYTWTDNVGNSTFISYTFNIIEDEDPDANCIALPLNLVLDAQLGYVAVDPSAINNGSTDNCGIALISVTPNLLDCTNLGSNNVMLTVVDESGNSASCMASVFVVDNTSPDVICPTNLTVPANASCQASIGDLIFVESNPVSGAKQFFDNSIDPCGVTFEYKINAGAFVAVPVVFNSVDLTGLVFNAGVNTVTVRVTDGSGNADACSFTVNVADAVGPTFDDTPANVPDNGSTVSLNTVNNGCGAFYTWTWPAVSDLCSAPTMTVLQSHAPGTFFPIGNTTVTYLAKDNVGNIGTYTFIVSVVDNQLPVAKCQNVTTQLNGAGMATVTSAQVDNGSTDNCFFNLSPATYNFGCANLGANIVTLTATDVAGNTATCTATITVQDLIPPVANCNGSLTAVDLNAAGTATLLASTVNSGSTDNCSITFAISSNGSPFASSISYNCDSLGVHLVVLRVTDAAGNTATCTRNITVRDVTAPTFTVPGPITIACNASTLPANTGQPTNVSDACDDSPEITSTDVINAGGCANSYTIIRTWKATDDSGNMSTANQTITVQDIVAPVFTMVSSFETDTDDPNFCDGPLTVTVTSSDISDNCTDYADLQFTYTVNYPTPSYGYVDINTPVPGNSVGAFFPIGTTVITFIARDECNNTSTHVVVVTVHDTQGPVFNYPLCGQAIVLPNTSGACSNLYSWVRPWSAVPNLADCQFFSVTENISNPTVQQSLNISNPFSYNGFFFQVFATAQFPVGVTTVTYTAIDIDNNVSTCAFTVEIEDIQAPALTCPGDQDFTATCPTAQVPDYRNLVQVSDNCPGGVTLTQTYAPGTTLGAIFAPDLPVAGDTFHITILGQDLYNSTSCSFVVTLQDGQAPIPTIAVLPALVDSCGGFVIDAPTATDPCNPNAPIIYGSPSTPVGTFIPGIPPKYNLMPGNYVITWVYNDGNGNISTQPQNITVLEDIFPPVALCKPGFSVNLNALGFATVTLAQINNGSYDPNDCGPVTVALQNAILDCTELGAATVSLIVTDHMNNQDTCTTTVTVFDVTPPALSALPANDTLEACDLIPPAANLTATDQCDDDVEIVLTETSTQDTAGFGFYNYTITRLWVATDTSGNSASASQVITVRDTEAPVFTGLFTQPWDTIIRKTEANDLNCDAAVLAAVSATDCATGDDLTITSTGGIGSGADVSGTYPVGTHIVVFTATDVSFNTSTKGLVIIVEDDTPPTAVCINGVSAALQPSGTVVVTPAQFDNNSFDNCPGVLTLAIQRLDLDTLLPPDDLIEYDCDEADGSTQWPVKLFVTDDEGNMSMCETYIVIQDNVDPTITFCPPSKTVVCTDNLSPNVHLSAQATDNCPLNVSVAFADSLAVPDSNSTACYLVNRVWTASDLAGNTATCVQTFSVLDTVAPVLSAYPSDITIECSENVDSPQPITATDDCSQNVPVLFEQDTINIAQGPCGNYSYTITRTRTAIDDCGNVEVHTRSITVVDSTGPQFPGLPDTITVFSASHPPNSNCTVPVSLNVSQYLFDCSAVAEMTVTNDAPHGNDSLSASGNYGVGHYMIHFTAIDACGNVGEDSVVVVVIDNSIPTAICNNNVVISLGSNGTATIQPDDIDLGSVDNCGIDSMFLNQSTFDCGDLGQNSVTLTVVDNYGNTNACTVNVNVTLGVGSGLSLDVQGNDESFFGATDGEANVTVNGGSGNFEYDWSNGDSTTTITNLPAGTYYVTVYDVNSGCQQVDSVTIDAGAKIKLTVGEAAGAQGEIVSVPVSVDNFNEVGAFSFTINVVDPSVGTVLGVSDTNAVIAPGFLANLLAGNNLGILWTDVVPLSLPNGTILFYVDVQLSGTAPVGSVSPVNVEDAPVVLSFTIDTGVPLDVPVDIMNGMVEINDSVNTDVTLAGDIKTWANPENPLSVEKPVANVTVNLSGTVSDSHVTDATGTYSFAVPLNANTLTECNKVTVGPIFNAGVTAGDLLRIVNHIFGDTLTSPYQWVAADVNNSKTITLADYLLIQRLALGTDQHIMNSPDWKFVPKSYVFPSNNTPAFGPLTLPFPQSIGHNPADQNFLDDDFVAIRMGDVNGNTPVTLTNDDSDDRSGDVFRLRLDERAIRSGEVIAVPFKASDFTNRQAYQLTINFDPTVFELADIQAGALGLTEENFGTAHLSDGHLTTLWVSRDPMTLPDDAVLFTLSFRALRGSSALSKVLRAGSEITRAEAYDLSGNIMKVDFEFVQPFGVQAEADFALYQNQPNPFRQGTSIGFRLPEAGRASLRVYNASGQMVKLVVGHFEQGYNEVRFLQSDIGTPGVYWYELETPTHSDRKKMILID